MRISKYERETVLRFNEAEDSAIISTYNKMFQKKLEKLCAENIAVLIGNDKTGSAQYIIPKKCIRLYPPKKIDLSQEERDRIGKRLNKHRRK